MTPISPDQRSLPVKITSVRTTPVLAPLPRPVRTASGTINQFPLVLIDVSTDADVVGRAYAQVNLPELLPTLERAVVSLAGMATGLPLAPQDVHAQASPATAFCYW